jgi:hypothetical protein
MISAIQIPLISRGEELFKRKIYNKENQNSLLQDRTSTKYLHLQNKIKLELPLLKLYNQEHVKNNNLMAVKLSIFVAGRP